MKYINHQGRPAGRKFWVDIPPWIIIGAVLILVPLFIFMTLQSIDKQRKLTTNLLVEKGDALIRSFEAGARTGAGLKWGGFQMQKLLIETAQQPGIDYLIVTDTRGNILADSDPSLVGESYGIDLDLGSLSAGQVQWRQVPNPEGADTFEVYRASYPSDSRGREAWIIFAGLDMGPVIKAREQDTRNTILIAMTLLLIGFAGIISLFLAQGYRSTRISLSRIKAFSDTLVENMPIGLVAVDQKRLIIAFNQTAESIFRRAPAEALGKKASEVLPDVCLELLESLKSGNSIIEKEIDCLVGGKDGRTPLEVIAALLEDDDRSFLGYVMLFRDMTEIQHLKREIERSRRLASLGDLAAGVAHEIRNPLSSIKGFATYFRERYRENPDDLRIADVMVQEVERLNRVIGQLLEFSRPLRMNRKKQEIGPVILHSLRMIENQARDKGVTVTTDLQCPNRNAVIDPDKMEQVFLNVYLNALSAMESGGTLRIVLRRDSGRRLRIDISDTGAGISKEDLPRIFDPYFTTKPSGTGLGLAIVHKIVEAHGGEIRVESESGKGTAVSIFLPLPEEETDR
ncbi:MAG: ATP-binding protein [Syntrophales bacterium]